RATVVSGSARTGGGAAHCCTCPGGGRKRTSPQSAQSCPQTRLHAVTYPPRVVGLESVCHQCPRTDLDARYRLQSILLKVASRIGVQVLEKCSPPRHAADQNPGAHALLSLRTTAAYCPDLCIVSCRADLAVDPSASGGEFSQAGSVSPSPRGELVTAPLCSSLHAPRLPPAALSERHPLGDESFEKAAHLGPTSPREYADPNRARRINNKTRRLALHAYDLSGRPAAVDHRLKISLDVRPAELAFL